MINWKTTVSGGLALLAGVALVIALLFSDVAEGKDALVIPIATGLIAGGFGLLNAKDSNTTGIGDKATKEENLDATKTPNIPVKGKI